ncbi:hypothetical protein PoB_002568300 [Plakobranchus ocellatus]|uniref:EF-hand domain-containing protein n=1 Tax=Plakobranchus ocellatus TaxID=259542 RepID=A0AAV3ZXP0_9GAST|nr:hypothetical protein PoB_002568300 [Plakobranchus ocellatus]
MNTQASSTMRPLVLLSAASLPCFLLVLMLTLQPHATQAMNIYGITDYGYRTVSDRLQTLGRTMDANKDGEISHTELANWAGTLGEDSDDNDDSEDDTCVTEDEFVAGLEKAGFTSEFATNYTDFLTQFPAGQTGSCNGLDTQALAEAKDDEANSVMDLLSGFLQRLTEFCELRAETQSDGDIYNTNTDCSTLPIACATSPFGCEPVCMQYTFVTTKDRTTGAFSERNLHQTSVSASGIAPQDFDQKLAAMFQDKNGDESFSREEQEEDYRKHYDTNSDGCVDEAEYKARMSTALCGGFDFSDEFTEAKYQQLKSADSDAECQGINVTLPDGADLSASHFTQENTQLLISACEGDKTLYETNQDCKQLPLICRVTPLSHREALLLSTSSRGPVGAIISSCHH